MGNKQANQKKIIEKIKKEYNEMLEKINEGENKSFYNHGDFDFYISCFYDLTLNHNNNLFSLVYYRLDEPNTLRKDFNQCYTLLGNFTIKDNTVKLNAKPSLTIFNNSDSEPYYQQNKGVFIGNFLDDKTLMLNYEREREFKPVMDFKNAIIYK